ncbi:MAG: patatin-like phospholipase family protein [Acidobacteriota bacterium]
MSARVPQVQGLRALILTEPSPPAKLAQVRAVAFEGGGINGLAYLPIIEALEDWGIRPDHLAGTSAGAITAMLWALGYDAQALRRVMLETPWDRFTASSWLAALWRLITRGGALSLDYPHRWLRERVLEAGFRDPDLTFAQLVDERGVRLSVAVTLYGRLGGRARAQADVLDHLAADDVPIATAVLASMAVPVVWPPVRIGDHWCCDGGVVANHPLHVFEGLPPEQILGLRLDEGEDEGELQPYRPGLLGMVRSLVPLMRRLANRAHVPEELWGRVVPIGVSGSKGLDFDVDEQRVKGLEDCGRAALEKWLAG